MPLASLFDRLRRTRTAALRAVCAQGLTPASPAARYATQARHAASLDSAEAPYLYPLLNSSAPLRPTPRKQLHPALPDSDSDSDPDPTAPHQNAPLHDPHLHDDSDDIYPRDDVPIDRHDAPPRRRTSFVGHPHPHAHVHYPSSRPSTTAPSADGDPLSSHPSVSDVSSSPEGQNHRPNRDPTRIVHFAPTDSPPSTPLSPVSPTNLPTDPTLLRQHLLRLLSERTECLRILHLSQQTATAAAALDNAADSSTPPPSTTSSLAPATSHSASSSSHPSVGTQHQPTKHRPSQMQPNGLDDPHSLPARLEHVLHSFAADMAALRTQLLSARTQRDNLNMQLSAARRPSHHNQQSTTTTTKRTIGPVRSRTLASSAALPTVRHHTTAAPRRASVDNARCAPQQQEVAGGPAAADRQGRRARSGTYEAPPGEVDRLRKLVTDLRDDKRRARIDNDKLRAELYAVRDDLRRARVSTRRRPSARHSAAVILSLDGEDGDYDSAHSHERRRHSSIDRERRQVRSAGSIAAASSAFHYSRNTDSDSDARTVDSTDADRLQRECDSLRTTLFAAREERTRFERERDTARDLLAGTLHDKATLATRVTSLMDALSARAAAAREAERMIHRQHASYEAALRDTRGEIVRLRKDAGELQTRVDRWKRDVRERDAKQQLVVSQLRERGNELARKLREIRVDGEEDGEREEERDRDERNDGKRVVNLRRDSAVQLDNEFCAGAIVVEEEEDMAGKAGNGDGEKDEFCMVSEGMHGRDVGNRGTQKASGLTTLHQHSRPLGATMGRVGSRYVKVGEETDDEDGIRFDHIGKDAFVCLRDGNVRIECEMVVGGELSEDGDDNGDGEQWLFVGFQYPDETSLSFLPVDDVTVEGVYESGEGEGESGRSSTVGMEVLRARVSMNEDVYEEVILRALYALIERAGSVEDVVLPRERVYGGRQVVDVAMMASCTVDGVGGEGTRRVCDVARCGGGDGGCDDGNGGCSVRGKALLAVAFRAKGLAGGEGGGGGGDREIRLAMELVAMRVEDKNGSSVGHRG